MTISLCYFAGPRDDTRADGNTMPNLLVSRYSIPIRDERLRKGKSMMINRRRLLQIATGAIVLPSLAGAARGHAYPARPVKIVVPVQPGGANDTATRLVAQKLSESLGQQFFVENMVGAGGNIAMGAIA